MPRTPFADEHLALGDSVRRLVDGPLGELARLAEAGGTPHADALAVCNDVGVIDVDDVLAETVVAQELGRLPSAGLATVLLDAILVTSLSLPPLETAVVRDATVTITEAGAEGAWPFVVGGQLARECLVLDQHVVVALTSGEVTGHARPLALRGSAPASVTLNSAAYRKVEIPRPALRRAELREAAYAVGAAWQTWHAGSTYAQQREAFGRPISKFQVNRHALADAATKITAAEALVHDTAWALATGAETDTAAARLYAGRVAAEVADRALQLHGGYGYTTEFDVERAWRDARALRSGDLTLRARLTSRGTA